MKLLILFSFILSTVQAFEIQCSTQLNNVDMVLKTSEMSNKTYLLFLNESQVEKYYPLDDQNWTNLSDQFTYQDGDTNISINKIEKTGHISSSGYILREFSDIQLNDCVEFF